MVLRGSLLSHPGVLREMTIMASNHEAGPPKAPSGIAGCVGPEQGDTDLAQPPTSNTCWGRSVISD